MTAKSYKTSTPFENMSAAVSRQFMVLHTLICWGDVDRFKEHLEEARDNLSEVFVCSDKVGQTLAIGAVEQKQSGILRLVVEAGADLEVVSKTTGCTALYRAAQLGQLDVVRFLVESGADKDFSHEIMGSNILMTSISAGRPEVALYLLDQGAKCDAMTLNAGAQSAADFAAIYDQSEVFLKLVEKGAFTGSWASPLQLAVHHGAEGVVRACLEDPILRAPVYDERCHALLEVCHKSEIRQMLLSWRSEQAIFGAMDAAGSSSSVPSQKKSGPAL